MTTVYSKQLQVQQGKFYRNDICMGIAVVYDLVTENWDGRVWNKGELDQELFRQISISFTPATPRNLTCKDGRVKVGKYRIDADIYHRTCDLICEIENQMMYLEMEAQIPGAGTQSETIPINSYE